MYTTEIKNFYKATINKVRQYCCKDEHMCNMQSQKADQGLRGAVGVEPRIKCVDCKGHRGLFQSAANVLFLMK